ncbi:hypothetical protein ACYT6K_09640 [Streptococcus pyogenes]
MPVCNNPILDQLISLMAMIDISEVYIHQAEVSDELANLEYMLKGMKVILDNVTNQIQA